MDGQFRSCFSNGKKSSMENFFTCSNLKRPASRSTAKLASSSAQHRCKQSSACSRLGSVRPLMAGACRLLSSADWEYIIFAVSYGSGQAREKRAGGMSLRVGSMVRFKDNAMHTGVVFEVGFPTPRVRAIHEPCASPSAGRARPRA